MLKYFGLLVVTATTSVLFGLLYRQPRDSMFAVSLWWTVLCTISVFNIWVWYWSVSVVSQNKKDKFRYFQLVLSAGYVFGCAFRSVMPRADVQRICLIDSWFSNVLVGRSVATIAELCFAAQWALLLNKLAKNTKTPFEVSGPCVIFSLIFIAEIFSWYSVITTCYIGNVVEESLWALVSLLLVISFIHFWLRCKLEIRPFIVAVLVLAVGYFIFMCTVDVPMYMSRWLTDEANGRTYLSFSQGMNDLNSRWTVTYSLDEWNSEIPWMTVYFSVGVWCSIALVHLPDF